MLNAFPLMKEGDFFQNEKLNREEDTVVFLCNLSLRPAWDLLM